MKLSKKEFLSILKNKEACSEAVKWVKESKTETFAELWNSCDRADWMLWILAQMARKKEWPSRKTVVLCACDCAETSLQFVPEDEPRPKIAIQTARKWAEGKATKIECAKAAYAAFAAYAAYADAAADAAHAAFAAAHTVDVVSAVAVDASAAFTADAYAADAYAAYAADVSSAASSSSSAAVAAKKEALRNMADIIRKRVTFEKE